MADTPTASRLALMEDMTIYNAMTLKTRLIETLAGTDRLELDLSGVAEIDSSGIQLLIMIKREATRLGKQAPIVAHSEAVSGVVDFLNLAAEFGDPLLVPAHQG